jgi:general secretion pathway protein D
MNPAALLLAIIFVVFGCAGSETFRDGQELVEAGNVEEGLERVEEALRRDPEDQGIRN